MSPATTLFEAIAKLAQAAGRPLVPIAQSPVAPCPRAPEKMKNDVMSDKG